MLSNFSDGQVRKIVRYLSYLTGVLFILSFILKMPDLRSLVMVFVVTSIVLEYRFRNQEEQKELKMMAVGVIITLMIFLIVGLIAEFYS